MKTTNSQRRERRHTRIRMRITGTAARPRLVVVRTLKYNRAQMINDENGNVLFETSDLKMKTKENKTERAKKVGVEMAKLAQEKGIKMCVFDRNGYLYHGRIKALADGAREGGLQF
ncbi:50S ribosomal protein L18 [Candidatus Gracilibacteria bacterium]|nr:50S ribosomal protein L18 [Candidatus Gracilibacteria bacterium]